MMNMKYMGWLIGTAAVMLLLPRAVVAFVKSDAGMAVIFLLFFIINPIYAIAAGFFAGRNIRKMWSLLVAVPILFLLGAWISFDMGEGVFLIYAGVYLVIGLASMLISSQISGKGQR